MITTVVGLTCLVLYVWFYRRLKRRNEELREKLLRRYGS